MKTLSKLAVLTDLTISTFDGTIEDERARDEFMKSKQAQANRGIFKKRMIPEVASLRAVKTKMYNGYRMLTGAFEEGKRILPIDRFDKLTKLHRECVAELEAALDAFEDRYDEYEEKAKRELGALWDKTAWLPFSEFRRKWGIRLDFFPVPEANHFIVDAEKKLINSMKKSFDEAMEARKKHSVADLQKRATETLTKVIDRLSSDNMKFRADREVMESVRELVDNLSGLNLFDDPNISTMIDGLKKNLCKIGDSQLQDDAGKTKAITQAKKMLDKMASFI